MSSNDIGSGCTCRSTRSGVEPAHGADTTVRGQVADAARRLGIEGADLDGLMAVFDQGACGQTRERIAELVDGRLGTVAQLQAGAAVLAEPSAPGACREECPCARAATPSSVVPRVPATRMGLTVSALDGSTGSDIACTLDGGVDAMRSRIDEWQQVIGRASGRRPAAGGVALTYEHDAAVAVELARLAAAEFACCSFFEFSLTVGPAGMTFAVSAPEEARDVITAVFGPAEPAPVG